MGNLVNSAFNVVSPVLGSGGSGAIQELSRPPAPPLKTKAVHGTLERGRAEYEFFNEVLGLLRPSMQTQFCRLVDASVVSRSNGQATDGGDIAWSTIEGLGARTYTEAINQTAHLLVIFLLHGNPSYKCETVQRIRQLVGEIIQQWEEEVRQSSERSGGRPAEDERAHQCTLQIWIKVRDTLDNSKRKEVESVFD